MWSFRGVGPPTSPRPNGRSYQGRGRALDGRIKECGGVLASRINAEEDVVGQSYQGEMRMVLAGRVNIYPIT